jgi:release factor H-coupled RctB family protein
MRSECRDRLSKRFTAAQLARTELGGRVICDDRELIFEEAPEAYKSIDTVVGALRSAGLIRVLARIKPLLTYKTKGER